MLPSEKPPNPFETLNAKDGFHVIEVDLGASISLHCQAYAGGTLDNSLNVDPTESTVQIREWLGPSPADHGECTRLWLVLVAITRYLNTGGQWDDLEDAVHRMRRVAIGGLYFDDWHLSDSYLTDENLYQHIFVRNDGSGAAVLWEEPAYTESGGLTGGFIDVTTLEALQAQDEDHEEGEDLDAVAGGDGDTTTEGPQLLH